MFNLKYIILFCLIRRSICDIDDVLYLGHTFGIYEITEIVRTNPSESVSVSFRKSESDSESVEESSAEEYARKLEKLSDYMGEKLNWTKDLVYSNPKFRRFSGICVSNKQIRLDVEFIWSRRKFVYEQSTTIFNKTFRKYEINWHWDSTWSQIQEDKNLLDDHIYRMTCSQVENPSISKSILVFLKDYNNPQYIFTKEDPMRYYGNLIPCISTDPHKMIKLYKQEEDLSETEYISNDLKYSPILGFTDTKNFEGEFKCKSDEDNIPTSEASWKTPQYLDEDNILSFEASWKTSQYSDNIPASEATWKTSQYSGFRTTLQQGSYISPNYQATMYLELELRLLCQSDNPQLEAVLTIEDDSKNFTFLYLEKLKNFKLISIVFWGISRPVNISCKDNYSKDVIWLIKLFDRPTLIFNRENTAVCLNKKRRKEDDFRSSYLKCSNPLNCRMSGCSEKSDDFCTFSTIYTEKCELADFNCNFLDTDLSHGVIICGRSVGSSHSFDFFTSLSDQTKRLVNGGSANIEDLITIKMEGFYYLNATNPRDNIKEPNCQAQDFLFSQSLLLELKYRNGSKEIVEQESFTSMTRIFLSIEKITIDLVELTCLAPWRNSSKFITISAPIHVRYETGPRITTPDENKNVTFVLQSTGNVLNCSVEGYPRPDSIVKWFHINGSDVNFIRKNETMYESILWFPKMTKELEGIYICQASNEFGYTTSADFFVKTKIPKENIETNDPKMMVGLSILLSVILIISIIIIFFLWVKYKKSKNRELTEEEIQEFLNGKPNANRDEISVDNPYDVDKFEIPFENILIDYDKILGSGQFGLVLKGELNLMEVAIKTTKVTTDINFFLALLSELKIISQIDQHSNIVGFLGASTSNIKQKKIYVVMEMCPLGNLVSYLRKNVNFFVNLFIEEKFRKTYENISQVEIDSYDLCNWSAQIAEGMDYLAEKQVIHGDLAARNILLYSKDQVKITDFGLSRQLNTNYSVYIKKQKQPLPWAWLALESLKFLTFSTKSDVWAFGVTIWEIFSLGEVPYVGYYFNLEFGNLIENGLRLGMPSNGNDKIYSEMKKCWENNPLDRPSFLDLKIFFNELMRNLKPEVDYHILQ